MSQRLRIGNSFAAIRTGMSSGLAGRERTRANGCRRTFEGMRSSRTVHGAISSTFHPIAAMDLACFHMRASKSAWIDVTIAIVRGPVMREEAVIGMAGARR